MTIGDSFQEIFIEHPCLEPTALGGFTGGSGHFFRVFGDVFAS